jgi:hypothetical protein
MKWKRVARCSLGRIDSPPDPLCFLFVLSLTDGPDTGIFTRMATPARKNDRRSTASELQPSCDLPVQPGRHAGRKVIRPRRQANARVLEGRPLTREHLEIWEKAAAFCVRHLPTLWTAGEPRQQSPQTWIVPIVLRYPDGYEGTLGEMAWDGQRQQFILLTDRAVLSERARLLASCRSTHGPISAAPEAGA